MIKARAGIQASDKTVLEEFRKNGVRFRKMKEKLLLAREEIQACYFWAKKRMRRSKTAWLTLPHAVIDNKHFQVIGNRARRDVAARRSVRGAYQKRGPRGAMVKPHLVKPKPTLKFPASGVQVTAAVIRGRVRMWEYAQGKWNGAAATQMYTGTLLKGLEASFPMPLPGHPLGGP